MKDGESPIPVLCSPSLEAVASALDPERFRAVLMEEREPNIREVLKSEMGILFLDGDRLDAETLRSVIERVATRVSVMPIVVSDDPSPERVVRAMRMGAADYIVRDLEGRYLSGLDRRLDELLQGGAPNTPRAIALRFNRIAHRLHHDIRNPLSNILGFLELLIDMPATKLSDDQAQFLTRARSNSDKALQILRDFIKAVDELTGRS